MGCFLLIWSFATPAYAQTWKPIGPDENDFPSMSLTTYNNIVIAPDGTPYIAYIDHSAGGKMTVKKFNGSTWEPVGSIGFSDFASGASLAIAPDGTLYVSYESTIAITTTRIIVQKFNGYAWETISPPLNTSPNFGGDYNSLAVAPDGTLYLSYAGYNYFLNGNMAYVYKFSGGVWTSLIPPNFGMISAGGTSFNKICIAPNGTPYIAYADYQQGNKITVKKYSNSTWTTVVAEGITSAAVTELSMAIAPDGSIYIAYPDGANSGKLSVQKFTGTGTWTNVGVSGFTTGTAISTYITIAPDGTPIVVAIDNGQNKKAVVKKYSNNTWVDVGPGIVSTGQTALANPGNYYYTGISVAKDGTPFIIYEDDLVASKAVVKKFLSGAWVNVGSMAISPDAAPYIDFKIDPNDIPYVAYIDAADSYKAYVKKYVNGSWQLVGSSFSQAKTSGQNVLVSLCFAPNGTPYVIYTDQVNGSYTSVVKLYNGTTWVAVGGAISASAIMQKMIMAPDGTPYVAFIDNSMLSVKKYLGGAWVTVGNANITTCLSNPQIAIATDGTLYSSCENGHLNGGNLEFMNYLFKLVNGTWQSMPSPGLPYNLHLSSTLNVAPDNTPYISFNDATTNYSAVIKGFNGTSWVNLPVTGLAAGYAPAGAPIFTSDGTIYMPFDSTKVTISSNRHVKKYKSGVWTDVGITRPAPYYSDLMILALPKTGEVMAAYNDGQLFLTQPTTDVVTPALAPAIISFTPTVASKGDTVIIRGSNFHTAASYSGVKSFSIGGVIPTSYTVNSDKQITAVLGSGATGSVSVTTFNGTATAPGFTYIPLPVITYTRPITFNTGDSVVLAANPSVGYSYQWYLGNTAIPGATSSSYAAYKTGVYYVTITTQGVTKTSVLGVGVTVNFPTLAQTFYISLTGTSCKGVSNGSITVATSSGNTYQATLTGNGVNRSATLSLGIPTFTGLAAGTYNICFTTASVPGFKQCQTVVITEPKDLSLYTTAISIDTKTITLKMGGGDIYKIQLNGILYSTKDSTITLPVVSGPNHLIMTSDRPCQGIIDQVISINEDVILYPNPFENTLNIALGNKKVNVATVAIYSSAGLLVFKQQFLAPSNTISLDLRTITTPGGYILDLFTDNNHRAFKIIRK